VKRRQIQSEPRSDAETGLYQALLSLRSVAELQAFFHDLCTPAELEALSDRWRVVPFLQAGMPYRDIHDRTGVSVTTIGRIARFLQQGNGGYQLAAQRLLSPREAAS
jgi:TrpR-related protein YerC/YecD